MNKNYWINFLNKQPPKHLGSQFRPFPFEHLAKVLYDAGYDSEAKHIKILRRAKQHDASISTIFENRERSLKDEIVPIPIRVWNFVLKVFVGYGFKPFRPLIALLVIIFAGALIYDYAAKNGKMTPTDPIIYALVSNEISAIIDNKINTKFIPYECRENWVKPQQDIAHECLEKIPSEYNSFNAWIYSIDTAIPLVNFRMSSDWAPRVVNWRTGQSDEIGWWLRVWEWFQIAFGWAFSLLFVSAITGIVKKE